MLSFAAVLSIMLTEYVYYNFTHVPMTTFFSGIYLNLKLFIIIIYLIIIPREKQKEKRRERSVS